MTNKFYDENAEQLAKRYLSLTFQQVHNSWLDLLPQIIANSNATVLDIGAGVGRDAKYIAEIAKETHKENNQIKVIAVEPAQKLLDIGQDVTIGLDVEWIASSLPCLSGVSKLGIKFDLILLSAVWMHLSPTDRSSSIKLLSGLLSSEGVLIISLRYGQTPKDMFERSLYSVCDSELLKLAEFAGLECKFRTSKELDRLGRSKVFWQTLIFKHKTKICI